MKLTIKNYDSMQDMVLQMQGIVYGVNELSYAYEFSILSNLDGIRNISKMYLHRNQHILGTYLLEYNNQTYHLAKDEIDTKDKMLISLQTYFI